MEHKDMNFSPSMSDYCNHTLKRNGEEKRAKFYSSYQKILLVGEGDFSFAASLAAAFGSAYNITATSLDSKNVLRKHNEKAVYNIKELKRKGCNVIHCVDATAIAIHPCLKGLIFDRVVFNFPYAVVLESDSRRSKLSKNQTLVREFLENAKKMIGENGEIHITHRIDGDYGAWRIKFIASQQGLKLVEAVDFCSSDYPGYNAKWGIGGDSNFDWFPSKTYKFRHLCLPLKIFPLATTTPESSIVNASSTLPNANILQSGEGTSSSSSSGAAIGCMTVVKLGVENDNTNHNKDSKVSAKLLKKSIWVEKNEITSHSSRNSCANHYLKQNDMGQENVKVVTTDITTTKPAASKTVDDVPIFPNANILQSGEGASNSDAPIECTAPIKPGVENDNITCKKDSKISTERLKSILLEKKDSTSSSNSCANHDLKQNDMRQENVKSMVEHFSTIKPACNTVDDVPILPSANILQCGEGASSSNDAAKGCSAPFKSGVENDNVTRNKDSKVSVKLLKKSIWVEKKESTSNSSGSSCANLYLKKNNMGRENVKGVTVDIATTKLAHNTIDDVPIFPNANILQNGESASNSSSSDAAIECTEPFKLGVVNDNTTCKKESKTSTKQLKSIWLEKKGSTSSCNSCANHDLKQNDMEQENVEGMVEHLATPKPASNAVTDVPVLPNAYTLQFGEGASSISTSDAAIECTAAFKSGVENGNTMHKKDFKISTKWLNWLKKKENASPSNSCGKHYLKQNDMGQENAKGVVVDHATTKPASGIVDDVPIFPNANTLQCGEGASNSDSSDTVIECTAPLMLGVENDNTTCKADSKISTKQLKLNLMEKREKTSSSNSCTNHYLKQNDMGQENAKDVEEDLATIKPTSSTVDDVPILTNANVSQCGKFASISWSSDTATECAAPFNLGVDIGITTGSKNSEISTTLFEEIGVEEKEITSPSKVCANLNLKQNEMEQELENGVVAEEKWIKHYRSSHKMLVVGEGDFSFSASLAAVFGSASNMTATSFNSEKVLRKRYGKAVYNIEELKRKGCKVMHGVDATGIASNPILKGLTFDLIILHIPSATMSKNGRKRQHKLVRGFLKAAREMINEDGEIHITQRGDGIVDTLILEFLELKQWLELVEVVDFNVRDYPGYSPEWGTGSDNNFEHVPSKIYKFRCSHPPQNIIPHTITKPANNTVEEFPVFPNANISQCEEDASNSSSGDNAKVCITTHGKGSEISTTFIEEIGLEQKEITSVSSNFCANHNLKQNDLAREMENGVVAEEKWIKHYSSSHKMLLVGEGDFSFAASLAASFGSASNMTATSLDSRKVLKKDYDNAVYNIKELRRKGCKVIHRVDATTIASHRRLKGLTFDRIIFNFPCAVSLGNDSDQSKPCLNETLVREFLGSAKRMIGENGEIHITHMIDGDYGLLRMSLIAYQQGLDLVEVVDFSIADYPGYNAKWGVKVGSNFCWFRSKTYRFRHAHPPFATHPEPASYYTVPNFQPAASSFDVASPQFFTSAEHSNQFCHGLFGNGLNIYSTLYPSPPTFPMSMNLPYEEAVSNSVYTAHYPSSGYHANYNMKQNEVQQAIKKSPFLAKEKRMKHYSSSHKMLLVGEGDFSFSASLAAAFGSASNMTSTSLDSEDVLKFNYCKAFIHLNDLKTRGCKVMHGVDATVMAYHPCLMGSKFDRIIFNFPFAGFFKNLHRNHQIGLHQILIWKFLENAKHMLHENGEIHITHKTNGFHREWNLPSLGIQQGLELAGVVDFKVSDYPGYSNKYGFGGDNSFNCSPCQTFMFRLPRSWSYL